MSFALHAAQDDPEQLWAESLDLALDNGYYTVTLGLEEALPPNLFDGSPLFLSVSVDGTAFEPRIELTSVPYAFLAGTAENATGDLTPRSITVGDQLVIDEMGAWVGPPVPDTLSGLSCDTGDVAVFLEDEWVCAAQPAGVEVAAGPGIEVAEDGDLVTVGVVFDGSGNAPTVAHSDHEHEPLNISGGAGIEVAQDGNDIEVAVAFGGPGVASTVARSDHDHGSAGVPIGTVIDWWRPNANFPIPDGYAIADGTVVVDQASPFVGQALPDLRGRFARGATNLANIGEAGGADMHGHSGASAAAAGAFTPSGTIAQAGAHDHNGQTGAAGGHTPSGTVDSAGAHSHTGTTNSGGNHSHPLPSNTGSVSSLSSDPGRHAYFARDDNQGWSTGVHLAVDGGSSVNEGQHRHSLGGNTNSAGGHSHGFSTGSAGSHAHDLSMSAVGDHAHNISTSGNHTHPLTMNPVAAHAHDVTVPTASNVPRYVGLLKLIRIR